MTKNWKKEVARDLMALGSIPFVILILARTTMLGNFKILFHIIVAIFLLWIISLKIKEINYHVAVIIILLTFTSIFYASYFYLTFALLVSIAALYAIDVYLKKPVIKSVITS